MTPEVLAELRERQDQVQSALNALVGSWAPIAREMSRVRAERVEKLITAESEATRGAIKMIDELLQLPNTLQQELKTLAEAITQ